MIGGFLLANWPFVLAGGGAIAAAVTIWLKGRNSGSERAARKDQENADRIADRVSRARHDPDKLHDMADRGFRD